eukprot:gb/GEZN01004747.1/.p1 GENE.gb/GEZN01004747.1/~~gb/GEZN01004747.1/.p1  ORF type:complete len:597 (+),score=9.27 gb/GEZN01004747.1/:9-1799(+)
MPVINAVFSVVAIPLWVLQLLNLFLLRTRRSVETLRHPHPNRSCELTPMVKQGQVLMTVVLSTLLVRGLDPSGEAFLSPIASWVLALCTTYGLLLVLASILHGQMTQLLRTSSFSRRASLYVAVLIFLVFFARVAFDVASIVALRSVAICCIKILGLGLCIITTLSLLFALLTMRTAFVEGSRLCANLHIRKDFSKAITKLTSVSAVVVVMLFGLLGLCGFFVRDLSLDAVCEGNGMPLARPVETWFVHVFFSCGAMCVYWTANPYTPNSFCGCLKLQTLSVKKTPTWDLEMQMLPENPQERFRESLCDDNPKLITSHSAPNFVCIKHEEDDDWELPNVHPQSEARLDIVEDSFLGDSLADLSLASVSTRGLLHQSVFNLPAVYPSHHTGSVSSKGMGRSVSCIELNRRPKTRQVSQSTYMVPSPKPSSLHLPTPRSPRAPFFAPRDVRFTTIHPVPSLPSLGDLLRPVAASTRNQGSRTSCSSQSGSEGSRSSSESKHSHSRFVSPADQPPPGGLFLVPSVMSTANYFNSWSLGPKAPTATTEMDSALPSTPNSSRKSLPSLPYPKHYIRSYSNSPQFSTSSNAVSSAEDDQTSE